MLFGVVVPLALAVDAMHEDDKARQRVALAGHGLAFMLGAVNRDAKFECERVDSYLSGTSVSVSTLGQRTGTWWLSRVLARVDGGRALLLLLLQLALAVD